MLQLSRAKLNIGLAVTEKRNDGYHTIESVFVPIELADVVELIPAKTNSLQCYGLPIPGKIETNSCLQTLQLLQEKFSIAQYAIHIYKVIPTGAGLGGGSSNSASVIRLLNERENLGLTVVEMQNLALQIGSDNAFFIESKPKFVTGRGEKLATCNLDLSGTKVVIIQPNVHINTAKAYQQIQLAKPTSKLETITAEQLISGEVVPKNVFEDVMISAYPETKEIMAELAKAGAFYSSLTGSGSCFYGLFQPNETIAKQLQQFAKKKQFTYFETRVL